MQNTTPCMTDVMSSPKNEKAIYFHTLAGDIILRSILKFNFPHRLSTK